MAKLIQKLINKGFMSNKQTFASAYNELQNLVSDFEKGEIDLESSIPKFKQATELAKFLKSRLKELENQIEEISLDIEKPSENNELN